MRGEIKKDEEVSFMTQPDSRLAIFYDIIHFSKMATEQDLSRVIVLEETWLVHGFVYIFFFTADWLCLFSHLLLYTLDVSISLASMIGRISSSIINCWRQLSYI